MSLGHHRISGEIKPIARLSRGGDLRDHAEVRVWVVVVVAVVACKGSKGAPDAAPPDAVPPDAAPPDASPFDGTYTCHSDQSGGDSCSQPLFEPGIQVSWSLALTGGELTCGATWTRAGRVCSLPLHLRAQADGSLSFWINTVTSQTATCAR